MDKNPVIDSGGTKRRFNEKGQLHRSDGPAIEYTNGSKFWWLNGQLHRMDGPACEWADGSKFWYLNGQYHRENGPAIEWSDGSKYWWLNGKRLEEDLHKELTGGPLDQLPLYLGQGFDEYIGERLRNG